MSTTFVIRGTDYIKQAVQKDNEEQYEQALHLYSRGIEFLVTGLKYEKNKRVVDTIREKIGKYLARAEQIKISLETDANAKAKRDAKRKKAQTASDRTNSSGGTSDNEDSEENKLKSALSEAIVMEKPNVKWTDVAGLEVAKQLLKEAVILPIRFPHIFVGKRKPWEGILLYGPPGTGKSYLAKAVASEANNSTFFSVSSSDLVSKYVGESEKLIKNLFSLARERKPSIIFIDEIDSLASSRGGGEEQDHTRRLKNEFLIQMSGVMGKDTKGVLVLGATNTPWDLDPAVRRRFKKRIYIPLPDKEARKKMFEIHIGNTPHYLNDFDFELLANRSDGFSGSDISAIVQDALMEPVRTILAATHFKKVYNFRNLNIQTPKKDNNNNNDNNNKNENIENKDKDKNKEKENNNDNNDIEMKTKKTIDTDMKHDTDNGSNDNDDKGDILDDFVWMPCSPNDPAALEMSLMKIPTKDHYRVAAEPLKLSHFLRVLQSAKPSVGKQDLVRQMEWTKQYGQEGR